MTVSYITVERVRAAMPASYTGQDDNILDGIITSASAWLDVYCERANGGFAIQAYDELYNGSGDQLLFLNNTPIQSIQRIATSQLPTLSIHNLNPDMGSRATIQILSQPSNNINLSSQNVSTGLQLQFIQNATTTTNTFLWTSYPTINSLAAGINALGTNWSATVMGGFGTWASSDLRATQGCYGARITTAYLWIHWFEMSWYRINEVTGEIWNPMCFTRGSFNWRINYTAGYSSFPDDLSQALSELVVSAYTAREQNANLQNETLGAYSYTQLIPKAFEGLSPMAKLTFNRYKIRKIPHFSTW